MESPCRISALFISARDIPRRRSLGYKLLVIFLGTHSECRRTQRLRPPLAHLGHVVAGLTPGKGSGDRAHSRGHGCRGLEKAVLSSTWGGVRMWGAHVRGAHVRRCPRRRTCRSRSRACGSAWARPRTIRAQHTHAYTARAFDSNAPRLSCTFVRSEVDTCASCSYF